MVDIVVIRGEGDKPGPDIVDPLLATVPAALARGRSEIDAATQARQINLDVDVADYRLGEFIEVHDAFQGASWRGQITGVQHSASVDGEGRVSVRTVINTWRPV